MKLTLDPKKIPDLAGLYLHIPFCRKLCFYCDFHFSVSLRWKERLIKALHEEIKIRADEGKDILFDTVYFGGGTPSVLSPDEIHQLCDALKRTYSIREQAEITLEANPDDLTGDYLLGLKSETPVNRLSIGIQAFQNRHLELMNRRHNAEEARHSIEGALAAGFNNLNVDLIYGIPGMTQPEWEDNLGQFQEYGIPHLSAYHLTFEPKTVFSHYLKKGKLKEIEEEISVEQYDYLLDYTASKGYDNYEISNFAREECFSKHNLGYWSGKHYLGFGPSAHSYRGDSRRWNVANNSLYMDAIENHSQNYYESETIDTIKAYNEYLLTALRTKWGISLLKIVQDYGREMAETCEAKIQRFLNDGVFIKEENRYYLSRRGKFISDYLIGEMIE